MSESEIRIVGVDPGTTTGVALVDVGGGAVDVLGLWHVPATTMTNAMLEVWELIRGVPALDVMVIEEFILFPDRKHNPDPRGVDPVRGIAGLDMLLALHATDGWVERLAVARQMPGEKDVVTDRWLRDAGLWATPARGVTGGRSGDGPHAMDALRHCIVYARKAGWL